MPPGESRSIMKQTRMGRLVDMLDEQRCMAHPADRVSSADGANSPIL